MEAEQFTVRLARPDDDPAIAALVVEGFLDQFRHVFGGKMDRSLKVMERWIRTLKEQCIYLHRFQSLAEAERIIGEFITRYNAEWLIERLGYRTPAQARADAQRRAA